MKERIRWIDTLRCIAVFCVILCHVVDNVYFFFEGDLSRYGFFSKIMIAVFWTIGRLGVPIFLMLTGYLLLDRDYDERECRSFWKNRWLILLICTELWFLIYEIFNVIVQKRTFAIGSLIREMLFLEEPHVSHLWYMGMILGMYIFVPMVAVVLKKFSTETLKFPMIFFVVLLFGTPMIALVADVLQMPSVSLQLSTGFGGGIYGVYLLIGYLIKKNVQAKIPDHLVTLVTGISLLGAVGIQLWAFSYGYAYQLWYDCPFVLVAGVGIFILCSRKERREKGDLTAFMSQYSFAVYMIHVVILQLLAPQFLELGMNREWTTLILLAVVGAGSYLLVWLLGKNKMIRKYLFYMK